MVVVVVVEDGDTQALEMAGCWWVGLEMIPDLIPTFEWRETASTIPPTISMGSGLRATGGVKPAGRGSSIIGGMAVGREPQSL